MQATAERSASEIAPDSPATTAIQTLELAKEFGSTVALAGLTMTVGKGEIFGFLGPNGAGKTTAVKLLVGLSKPTRGEGWVLGERLGNRAVRSRIGYLPELFRYQDWLTGREVMGFHCRLAGIPRDQRERAAEHALELAGIAGRADDRVGAYSKGMQQRLGLAVALVGNPEVLFLDEPTSALDPVGRHDVREIIRTLKARGTTVFLNSHLLGEVELVCDRVAIVDQGRVIAIGTIDELRGAGKGVRIRAEGVDEEVRQSLRRFGPVEESEGWTVVRGIGDDAVPEIVRAVVQSGARVYAVQPAAGTLEDTFLKLLEGAHDGHPDHS